MKFLKGHRNGTIHKKEKKRMEAIQKNTLLLYRQNLIPEYMLFLGFQAVKKCLRDPNSSPILCNEGATQTQKGHTKEERKGDNWC